MHYTEDVSAVVIDAGSLDVRGGLACEQAPSLLFRNCIGKTNSGKADYVGSDGYAGYPRYVCHVERGMVTNWDEIEQIWNHVFSYKSWNGYGGLGVDCTQRPVLLTESPTNPKLNRERGVEIMFERFEVPAMYPANSGALSLFAAGRTTGITLESGDGVTHAVPIYEGLSLPHATVRSDFAGRDLTAFMRKLMQENEIDCTMREACSIKEKLGYVAPDFDRESAREMPFELPDGRTITIGRARFRCGEGLFRRAEYECTEGRSMAKAWPCSRLLSIGRTDAQSALYGLPKEVIRKLQEAYIQQYVTQSKAPFLAWRRWDQALAKGNCGVDELLWSAIEKCDIDLHGTMYQNVVLSGGNTMFPFLNDRLCSELAAFAPKNTRIKVIANGDRTHAAWIGGSILASLRTCDWVLKGEYDEYGPANIHWKIL